jgi:P27 family predicted phage terminase small subunit
LTDLRPPRQLTAAAAEIYERHARRLFDQGRLAGTDTELLAVFAETLVIYVELQKDVETRGVVVPASRGRGLAKNPSLSPLQATRTDLIRLSKSIPLFTGQIDRGEIDKQIQEILSE